MAQELFDRELRALRRDRGFRQGPELFLHERAFDDVLERLTLVNRTFRSALLVDCPDPRWTDRLLERVDSVGTIDSADLLSLAPGAFDLCIAIGVLDTLNELPDSLLPIRFALEDDSLFIGALSGGETLPQLRAAMRAADEQMGAASAHVHPRVEPAALTSLLTAAGFAMPVVDVDRVQVSYESLADLVRDLRSMGATNVLSARSRRPLTRAAAASAAEHFASQAIGGRTVERFDLLHFAAWTPAATNG